MNSRLLHQITTIALTGVMLSTSAGLSIQAGFAAPRLFEVALTPKLAALPESVEQKVRQAAAQEFGVQPSAVNLVSFNQQTWMDSCLGLGGAAEICAQALIEGWRVEVSDGQNNLTYRTDSNANTVRLEPRSSEATLPIEVSQRLLNKVSRQVRVPVDRLKIAAVRSTTWDGCLGIFKPRQACTRIALPGWQAIVTNGERSWIYHFDQSGTRIVQNSTASGSRGGLVPSFIPEENKLPSEDTVVFQSIVSGDLAGTVTRLSLTKEGVITKYVSAPNIRTRPVIVKRLSQPEVERFEQLLQTQRFPNLHNLRYLSSAAFADYPTTTLQGMGMTTQYIDLETKNLPRSFQSIIQTWDKLSK
ncbi:MAG: hypothetical protein KME10_07675 [Plectolyngbya sp. WJT66-NPBG17]|jgi:hypothetical protein|nr:hypothetical protein [Plectolyngbya sp. WJT66-NPBG17]